MSPSRRIIIVLPGLFGSHLVGRNGEVWPPSPLDRFSQLKQRQKISDPTAVPTVILRSAYCNDAYGPLLARLDGLVQLMPRAQFLVVTVAYDWRRSLEDSMNAVGDVLTETLAGISSDAEIVFVAHSMGGLIARGLLETYRAKKLPWISQVCGLIMVGTPNGGSIEALMGVLGVEGRYGLSGSSVRRLVLDGAVQSLPELIPGLNQPIVMIRDGTRVNKILPLDLHLQDVDPEIYGLLNQYGSARNQLNVAGAPSHCRYFTLVSGTHKTGIRVSFDGHAHAAERDSFSGDGTVSIHHSLVRRSTPVYAAKGNHIQICDSPEIINLVCYAFNLRTPADAFSGEEQTPFISISPIDPTVGEAVEIYVEPRQAQPSEIVSPMSLVVRHGLTATVGEPLRAIFPGPNWIEDFIPRSRGTYHIDLVDEFSVLGSRSIVVHDFDEHAHQNWGTDIKELT
jgi:pimeloyl-ACP methyl ester carboxylesterase